MITVQVGDTLEEFLVEATSDAKLRQTMMSLSEAVRTIAFKVRNNAAAPQRQRAHCSSIATTQAASLITTGCERGTVKSQRTSTFCRRLPAVNLLPVSCVGIYLLPLMKHQTQFHAVAASSEPLQPRDCLTAVQRAKRFRACTGAHGVVQRAQLRQHLWRRAAGGGRAGGQAAL